MAPQFVKPYVKTNKNDRNDAEAICEAVSRSNMRFVPIKTIDQQSILSIHRVRERLVKSRTALSNEIRGLLSESGIIMPLRSEAAAPYIAKPAAPKFAKSISLVIIRFLIKFINFYGYEFCLFKSHA